MSKRAWYLIGLVLLAGACSPVLEPRDEAYTPSIAKLKQLSQDSTPQRPPQHRKREQP